MSHIFFRHSSVDGHLGCFCVFSQLCFGLWIHSVLSREIHSIGFQSFVSNNLMKPAPGQHFSPLSELRPHELVFL